MKSRRTVSRPAPMELRCCGMRADCATLWPSAVEHGGGVVEQLAHDGGAAGAPDGDVHLGGGGGEGAAEDLEFDGAERLWHGAVSGAAAQAWRRVAARLGRQRPAGRDEDGGVVLLHDQRARRAGRSGAARWMTATSCQAPPAKHRAELAGAAVAAAAVGRRSIVGQQAERGEADGDDLHRVGRVGVGEALGVQAWKRVEQAVAAGRSGSGQGTSSSKAWPW